MPKYYVQSEQFSVVVSAADSRGAALFLVDQLIRKVTAADAGPASSRVDCDNWRAAELEARLGDRVRVSEIGWGRSEAGAFRPQILLAEWHQLAVAVERLAARLR